MFQVLTSCYEQNEKARDIISLRHKREQENETILFVLRENM